MMSRGLEFLDEVQNYRWNKQRLEGVLGAPMHEHGINELPNMAL